MIKKFSDIPAANKAANVLNFLDEHKAQNLSALDLTQITPLTEVAIIATASSARHARSLADGVLEMCGKENYEFLHMEGYQEGQWVLADLNDIIVHIFQEPVRELYQLEALWHDAPPLARA